MAIKQVREFEELYVGGEWIGADETLDVSDRAEGDIFARVAAGTREHATDALAAAEGAESAMREATIVQRARWLEAIADGILDRRDELADAIVREAGKPVSSARGEVSSAAERFERAAEEVRSQKGEFREGSTTGHEGWRTIVEPIPVGTVLCITPYNYPLATTALQVAPALAAGNSVVLKPSTKTPVSAVLLAKVIEDVGLPDGAFNLVTGRSGDVGDALAGDDRVDAIAMTGSSNAGEHVAAVSKMVDLHMELGGNAPEVVFPDADVEAAAAAATKGSFKYAGQRCSAISRVLAHESVHDELVERIEAEMDDWPLGDLFDEGTALGPLIDESQAEWVEELVEDAVERGARIVRGGEREGAWFEPTLLADVPRDARIVHEEQFGPVAVVARFADEREALDVANGGDLALDACVFTSDYDRAMRVADALDAGAVRINGAPSHGLGDIPFGGTKKSGIGREGIGVSIEAFSTTKSIIL